MANRASLAALGLSIGAAAALLLLAPTAVAAPTPLQYNPDEIYNDTYNDTSTALNLSTNGTTRLLFYLDCANNDYDYMYVWLPAGLDLAVNIETEAGISFRFLVALRSPEHFNLVVRPMRPQVGEYSLWYNTTTWIDGPYYITIDGPSCPTPSNWYNVTWTASATSAVSDGDNFLASATDVTAGPTVTGALTETFDQADFFAVTAAFTPPTFQYLQLSSTSFEMPFYLELYNSTGVSMVPPQTETGWDPVFTANLLETQGFRFPAPGTYYLRLWTASWSGSTPVLQEGNYSMTFTVAEFTPSPNIDYANATIIGDNYVKNADALNFSFEVVHYFKIFIASPRTLWADATSNQIDIQLQLMNETPTGSHLQQRLSRHPFDGAATPKDHESWNYTVTANQLAASTGWFYVIVKMDSDLPPNGLFNLTVWLNDRPAGSTQTQTRDEDVALLDFDVGTLFTDLDCTLDALDPDCTLSTAMQDAAAGNVTFAFAAGLLNATPAADWSGTECRMFNASDEKGLNATATLCVTFVSQNDPPVVVPGAESRKNMTEDRTLIGVRVWAWFEDVDGDTLTITFTGDDNLTVFLDGPSGLGDFVPGPDFNGFNNLTFTASDGVASVSWRVEFYVIPDNDAPEARGSLPFVTVAEDGTATLNLNLVDIGGVVGPAFTDRDGDALTYTIVNTEPGSILVTVSGAIVTIQPAPNISDRFFFFEIEAHDGLAASPRASVRVDVTPVNDPPQIDVTTPAPPVSVAEGESQAFSVTASDPDGETPRYQWFVDAVGQSGATSPSFTLATQVTDELARTVVVRVNVSDAQGTWVDHEWTLTITNTNQGPDVTITAPTTFSFAADVDISFSATAMDPDGDTLTWSWTSDRVGLPIGSAQTVTAKLPVGSNLVTVDVFDGHRHATANVTITVTPAVSGPNDGPNLGLIVGAIAVIGGGVAAAFVLSKRRKSA